MSQPVAEDRYDTLSYVGLTVCTFAGVALVVGFLGSFIFMVVRSLGRGLFG